MLLQKDGIILHLTRFVLLRSDLKSKFSQYYLVSIYSPNVKNKYVDFLCINMFSRKFRIFCGLLKNTHNTVTLFDLISHSRKICAYFVNESKFRSKMIFWPQFFAYNPRLILYLKYLCQTSHHNSRECHQEVRHVI